MKFSAKFEYALLALLYLKCEPDEDPVSGKALAEKLNLPYRFLEQILSDLKKAGLVRSVRGYQGGYKLNLEPESISAYDIYQVTDGKFEPWDCSQAEADDRCGQNHNYCVINQFYVDFKSTFIQLLKSYTLDKMCQASTARRIAEAAAKTAAE